MEKIAGQARNDRPAGGSVPESSGTDSRTIGRSDDWMSGTLHSSGRSLQVADQDTQDWQPALFAKDARALGCVRNNL
jgi:hypothetical protein